MKIVMITPYYPPIIGGITNYVFYLTNYLKKIESNDVIVITKQGSRNTDVISFNTNKISFSLKSFRELLKYKPNVIHSHGGWYTLLPGFLYRYLHPNCKVIHTEHTEPSPSTNFYIRMIIKIIYSHCDWLVYTSENTRNILEKDLKIHTNYKKIHGGVFVEPFTKKDVDVNINKFWLNKLNDGPIVAYLGPLAWKMKVEGVKRLILSFQVIIKEYPHAVLLIMGDGQYRKELETLVNAKGLEKNIIFTGFIKPHALLSTCDIYAHISLMDSFPLAILEAMYLGLPVVATKVGDIPELVHNNETGILVNPDEKSIAKSILELWDDKEKMKILGEKGKKLVEDKYGWDKIVEKYMGIYN